MSPEPMRVLMIDDDPDDFLLVRQMLRGSFNELAVVHAPTPADALRLLRIGEYEVALLDFRLGGTNGLDLLPALGERRVPVIVLTGEGGEEVAVEALKRGARDYLSKTKLTEQGLTNAVRHALAIERKERQLEDSRRELAAREERFRALVENSSDCVSLLSPDLHVTYVSQSVRRHFGYDPEQLQGEHALARLHPEDRAAARQMLTSVARSAGVAVPFTLRLQHADGGYRHVEGFAMNRMGDSAVRAVVLNFRDVTERRALQEQLAHAQKMEAVGQLAGGVAHDFNNLLLVVSSYAELLLDGVAGEPRLHRHAEEIIKAVRRAAGLTRQLLAFSRKQEMCPVVLDLNGATQDLAKMLARLLGETIDLRVSAEPDLWRVKVDPIHIEQVIMNLAVNAREAMPEGGVLEIGCANVRLAGMSEGFEPQLTPGEYVRLSVRDTGKGISPEILPHIFEPFFTTREGGSGLGLPTVYGIVQQSGGAIRACSEVGRGTTFEILLPRADAIAVSAVAPVEVPAQKALGGETILLVEDDDAVRESATEFLSLHGYAVLQAKNGAEALDLVNRFEGAIDIVVSDVIMPVMSGPELGRRLASLRPSLRVLFISGYTENMFAKYGVTPESLLQKPFTLSALSRRVRQILDAPVPAPAGEAAIIG